MKMNLGARESPIDNRDIQLGRLQPNISYPESFISNIDIEPLYQSSYPMCGAFSGTHLAMSFERKEFGERIKLSPIFLWKMIKMIDGFPPEAGTDLRSIFKALSKYGVCKYDLLPIEYGVDLSTISKNDTTDLQREDAHPRMTSDVGYGVGYDIESLKKDIFLYGYAIVLLKIGNTWWNKTEVSKPSKIDGGHFVEVYGYDKDGIFIVDSADKNVPFKKILNTVPIIEYRAAFDCENWKIKIMINHVPILSKIVELLQKLIYAKKVGTN